MRKLILAVVFVVTTTAASMADEWTGVYALQFSQDAGWHHNALVVSKEEGGTVRGTVSIDWGIGPEARSPNADERVHEVPFVAKHVQGLGELRFKVTVGKLHPTTYDFDLFPVVPSPGTLVGVVTETRSGQPNRRLGVLARHQ